MKLLNGEHAIVDIGKLKEYCLNPNHPHGRDKARVFAAVGIRLENAEALRAALTDGARVGRSTRYSESLRRAVDDRFCLDVAGPDSNDPKRREFSALDELLCTIEKKGHVMADLPMHSMVALLEGVPDQGLVRGQVGVVVADWAAGVYDVEFADSNGVTYAMVALKAEQLMLLHHQPVDQAA